AGRRRTVGRRRVLADSITYICECGFTMSTVSVVVKITPAFRVFRKDPSVPRSTAPSGERVPAPAPGSRRAEIALVAAEEFTRRGYHSTRVEHIADRLSVTPGALYRHVPGKYEMFRDATFRLTDDLEAATRAVPPADLGRLVSSVTATTLTHRRRAALYRWQGRYLGHDDRARVARAADRTHRAFADAVLAHRGLEPDPACRQDPAEVALARGTRSAASAILSTIASLGDHRVELSPAHAVAQMTSIAVALAASVPARCRQAPSGVRGRGARPPGTRARPRLPPGPRRGRPGTRHAIRGERDPVHHRLPGRPPRRALPRGRGRPDDVDRRRPRRLRLRGSAGARALRPRDPSGVPGRTGCSPPAAPGRGGDPGGGDHGGDHPVSPGRLRRRLDGEYRRGRGHRGLRAVPALLREVGAAHGRCGPHCRLRRGDSRRPRRPPRPDGRPGDRTDGPRRRLRRHRVLPRARAHALLFRTR